MNHTAGGRHWLRLLASLDDVACQCYRVMYEDMGQRKKSQHLGSNMDIKCRLHRKEPVQKKKKKKRNMRTSLCS